MATPPEWGIFKDRLNAENVVLRPWPENFKIGFPLLFSWKCTCILNAQSFSLIVSYGLHTSFINSLVQKNKNIHANPIKSLRFGLCHTFTPRPWKHGFAFTPQAWRYDTNQTLSIKIQLKRMIYLQQELGSLGLPSPRDFPRASPSGNPSGKANPGSPSLL